MCSIVLSSLSEWLQAFEIYFCLPIKTACNTLRAEEEGSKHSKVQYTAHCYLRFQFQDCLPLTSKALFSLADKS